MIPVLGIPHYNRPDLLLRCLRSIDHPVRELVIIQNGPDSEMPRHIEVPMARNVTVVRHPNSGVAGSWNEIIKLWPAPWWMLVNNDIMFSPGDLKAMADEKWRTENVAALYGNHGASFWIVTANGVKRVGLFDENLYPAYLEDCDWSYRMKLIKMEHVDVPGVCAVHGEEGHGSCTIMSNEQVRAENHRTHGNNFRYYLAKWGGNNGEEKYLMPFNLPVPVTYWSFNPEFRAEQQWRWK